VPLVVLAATAVLVVREVDKTETLPEKLGGLIVNATPGRSCIGREASLERVSASDRPDLYPDLLPYARSAEVVSCDDLGAVSVVVEFSSNTELQRALARSRSARDSAWCVVGAAAFSGRSLDHPGQDLRASAAACTAGFAREHAPPSCSS
jgi:hypothetical protein